MKAIKVYYVYLDDGHDALKITVPAESKKDAAAFVSGNGEIIAIKEDPDITIRVDRLADDLRRTGWGEIETDVITRLISLCGLEYKGL